MYSWIINVWGIQWNASKFKVDAIELEFKKSTKFYCFVLMTKYISKTMGIMD